MRCASIWPCSTMPPSAPPRRWCRSNLRPPIPPLAGPLLRANEPLRLLDQLSDRPRSCGDRRRRGDHRDPTGRGDRATPDDRASRGAVRHPARGSPPMAVMATRRISPGWSMRRVSSRISRCSTSRHGPMARLNVPTSPMIRTTTATSAPAASACGRAIANSPAREAASIRTASSATAPASRTAATVPCDSAAHPYAGSQDHALNPRERSRRGARYRHDRCLRRLKARAEEGRDAVRPS
jgi:hypothetical protein